MNAKHVFLSYIREDGEAVDELEAALTAAGFEVWRDTKDLWPGDNWELKIREAIQSGSMVFLGCFSSSLAERDTSYQYAELMIAADEYRLRPLDTNWLMTVRFDECVIPPVDLGGGRTLDRTINRVDLFGDQKVPQMARLITSIHRIIESSPGVPSAAVLEVVSGAKRAEDSPLTRIRELLRNPGLVMDYDEYMQSLRTTTLDQLRDRERFPLQGSGGSLTASDGLAWVERIHAYEDVIAPLLEPLKLISMYGQQGHEQALTQLMRAIAQECLQDTGLDFYRSAHEFPAVALTYVIMLSALTKQNLRQVRAGVADVDVRIRERRVPFVAVSGAGSVAGNWNMVATMLCLEDEGSEGTQELMDALLQKRQGARYTPISDHLFSFLAPLFRDNFASDEEYADEFDRAEVLLDAIAADARLTIEGFYGGRGGYGRYTWRHRYVDTTPEANMKAEAEAVGSGWTPLLSGVFGGDPARAIAALDIVTTDAKYLRQQRW